MNSDHEMFLARKYATACLRISTLSNDSEQVCQLQAAALFFQRYGILLWHQPKSSMMRLLQGFGVYDASFEALLELLEQHHRLFLFPRIFCFFVQLFKKKNHVVFVRLGYSHQLTSNMLDQYYAAIARLFENRVLYLSYQKPSLIAGLEVAADEVYWEHSVRRSLRLYARGVIGGN